MAGEGAPLQHNRWIISWAGTQMEFLYIFYSYEWEIPNRGYSNKLFERLSSKADDMDDSRSQSNTAHRQSYKMVKNVFFFIHRDDPYYLDEPTTHVMYKTVHIYRWTHRAYFRRALWSTKQSDYFSFYFNNIEMLLFSFSSSVFYFVKGINSVTAVTNPMPCRAHKLMPK